MPLRYGSIVCARWYPTQCGQVLCVILNYAHLKCVVEYKNIKQHLLGHICTDPMECFFKTLLRTATFQSSKSEYTVHGTYTIATSECYCTC